MLVVATIPSASASDEVLEGWDNYKFGMTIEQVRDVPGIAWGEVQTPEVTSGDTFSMKFTFLEATAPVTIGAHAYDLKIYFKPDIGLTSINFEDKTAAKSTAACELRFTDALAAFERKHGAFAARQKAGKTPTPFGALDLTWRKAPTGASTYEYTMATMQFEPKGPVHRSIVSSVTRRFGNKLIGLSATSPGANTQCIVSLGYTDTSAY